MGVIVDVDACHPPAPTTPSSLVVNTQQSEERGARVVALEGATRSSSDTDTAVAVTAAVNVAEESTDIFSMDGPQTQNATFINGAAVNPSVLQFRNVRYSIDIKKNKKPATKHILSGISGQVEPGQVLAIMGASGAGKTTLLNMLAGRLSQSGNGRTEGQILVNGQKRDFDTFRQQSAYVLQQDNFFAQLTVRETITLSALLRLPKNMSRKEKMERVDSVIAELGLTKVEDTLVGDDLVRGVSGGERKRVNVATELVTNPSLIFLDEPTTGLDSFNAYNVMSTLLQLARAGRTIVATIHQPNSKIVQLFDMLLLLSEGRTMYFGEAQKAVPYFDSVGFKCPLAFNPADFYLDLISLDQRSNASRERTEKRIAYLADKFEQHEKENPMELMNEASRASVRKPKTSNRRGDKYSTSWLTQFWLMSWRSFVIMTRDKLDNFVRYIQVVFFSLVLGFIWLQEGREVPNKTAAVQAVAGALFFLLINQAFSGIFGIIYLFPSERGIVFKERASRSYHVGAYFWSKSMAELPRTFSASLLFAIITYAMVGLRFGVDRFFLFTLCVFCIQLAAEGLAYIVSAFAKDPQQAGAIAPAFIVTSMLFGGFFIGTSQIPIWLSWLRYASFLNYGFAAIMQNEFEGRDFGRNCTASKEEFCFESGAEVLDFYSIEGFSLGENLTVLICLSFIFRFIAYYILRRNGPVYNLAV